MNEISVLPIIASLAMGCGPEVADGGDDPPGVLEYESPTHQIYRIDRRLDIVGVARWSTALGAGS
jgi:hypothetical protein